jgi:hypothetical protein
MTATEYLKKERYGIDWFPGLLVFAVAMSILGAFWYVKVVGNLNVTTSGLLLYSFVPPVVLVTLTTLGAILFVQRFRSHHPEMANLHEWVALMGSAESYPVDVSGAMAQMPMARTVLETYARSANAAIMARQQIEKLLAGCPNDLQEAAMWRGIQEYLADVADAAMQAYNRRFQLFDDTHLLLSIPVSDARRFRESFLKRD